MINTKNTLVDLDKFPNEGFEDSILCENEESASTISGELYQ